jgi:hypothetical protein
MVQRVRVWTIDLVAGGRTDHWVKSHWAGSGWAVVVHAINAPSRHCRLLASSHQADGYSWRANATRPDHPAAARWSAKAWIQRSWSPSATSVMSSTITNTPVGVGEGDSPWADASGSSELACW